MVSRSIGRVAWISVSLLLREGVSLLSLLSFFFPRRIWRAVLQRSTEYDPPISCWTRRRLSALRAMNNENSPNGETAGKAKKKSRGRALSFDCADSEQRGTIYIYILQVRDDSRYNSDFCYNNHASRRYKKLSVRMECAKYFISSIDLYPSPSCIHRPRPKVFGQPWFVGRWWFS